MLTFKEYHDQKVLNERLFFKGINYDEKEFPIYLNPTQTDLIDLSKKNRSIRGFTKGEYVFIWGTYESGHQETSNQLDKYDPDLKELPADICFYLERADDDFINQLPTPKFNLVYSSWTGQSTNNKSAMIHLRKLLQYKSMAGILPLINNIAAINQSNPYNHMYKNAKGYNQNQDQDQAKPISVPSSIAAWQQAGSINPYMWKNGMQRVGD